MIDVNTIKSIPILEYLTFIGHQYSVKGDTAYCCAAIVRPGADNPRNLTISLSKNLWRDQVSGKGGSIIDLVMAHQAMSYDNAIRWIDNWQRGRSGVCSAKHSLPSRRPIINTTPLVLSIEPLHRPMWINYLKSRYIEPEVAKELLYEIRFRLNQKDYDNVYCGLGWRGRNGQWHIRTKMNKLAKISTSPADITHIARGSDEVCVFEGVMDYLAFASRWGMSRDVIILNSTSHSSKAISLINEMKYKRAHLYLDNDEAGDHATDLLTIKLPMDVTDHRQPYQTLCINDVNAYIIYLNRGGKMRPAGVDRQ